MLNFSIKHVVSLILITGFIHFAYAQLAGEKCQGLPAKYIKPSDPLKNITNIVQSKPWIVYSDRINNISYETAELKKIKHQNIALIEDFYVAEETLTLLRVAKDAYLIGRRNRIDAEKKAVDIILGWIPKNIKLLVLNDKQAAQIYASTGIVRSSDVIWTNNDEIMLKEGRLIGEFMRFPVIDKHSSTDILSKGCFGENGLFLTAYAPIKSDQLQNEMFRKVLLLSRLELFNIINDIESLQNSYGENRRERMRDTWITILERSIGKINREEMMEKTMEKTMEDITKMLYDVPTNSSFLSKLRLKDITDRSVLPDDQFEIYIAELERKIV